MEDDYGVRDPFLAWVYSSCGTEDSLFQTNFAQEAVEPPLQTADLEGLKTKIESIYREQSRQHRVEMASLEKQAEEQARIIREHMSCLADIERRLDAAIAAMPCE